MSGEPENLVLELLRSTRADVGGLRAQLGDVRGEIADIRKDRVTKRELRSEIQSRRADVASDLLVMAARSGAQFRDARDQIAGLRRAVVEYHSAVVGHGVLVSDRGAHAAGGTTPEPLGGGPALSAR